MTDEKKAELRAALSKELGQKLESETLLSELDSMDIMSLAVGIEKYAGIEIGYGEISQCDTYGDLEAILGERKIQ